MRHIFSAMTFFEIWTASFALPWHLCFVYHLDAFLSLRKALYYHALLVYGLS